MAASDHLQPRLFMQAKELYAMSSIEADLGWGGDMDAMRSAKRADLVRRPRIAKSIARSAEPVEISLGKDFGTMDEPQVADGNHRVTAAYDRDPDSYVPVVSHENYDQYFAYQSDRPDRDVNWHRGRKVR